MEREALLAASLEIVRLLSENDYDGLRSIGALEYMSEDAVRFAISDYGENIDGYKGEVDPPVGEVAEGYAEHFSYISSEDGKTYWTYLDLYLDGMISERSDLTLICLCETENDKVVRTVIDDIHVM